MALNIESNFWLRSSQVKLNQMTYFGSTLKTLQQLKLTSVRSFGCMLENNI